MMNPLKMSAALVTGLTLIPLAGCSSEPNSPAPETNAPAPSTSVAPPINTPPRAPDSHDATAPGEDGGDGADATLPNQSGGNGGDSLYGNGGDGGDGYSPTTPTQPDPCDSEPEIVTF
ncbi:hypothetical protein [Corynebacterium sp. 21KM1197]|uniref:hypothetical protein n=1 Tax=Corynebacterium sp. 21KM1197 TaxID=2989734 RepID=UPI0029CA1D1B|nr:hypothetical protein [Corynebacterium sp. 21KM1197]WPF68500.1 hypothetical protein OLW90_10710 [Corynebacterium sp. 21KM1197]